ncbi:alpha/beta fold hydrolase [Sneathiella sp.]|uniref:alpha/beta fold hydrolase n=1 Tax=Sneathiella sp. TaxID=1964365 RepID=UPI003562977A
MTEIVHNTAKVGDLTLHYAETGAKNETLVLMLHGFPEFWYCWKDQLPVIGESYHAVAPDMRGYNLSDKPEGVKAYTIGKLIGDVIGLADHFGQEQFYLVAHDWGAAIAWAVAIGYPDRVKGLVILNGPHPYIFSELLAKNETQIAHSQYIAKFQEIGVEEEMLKNDAAWLWNWTFRRLRKSGQMSMADEAAYREAWCRPGALTAMLNYYRASPLQPATEETKGQGFGLDPEKFRVRVPTLVIWGEADHALIAENLVGLDALVEDLTIIRLPGVSHWVTHEAPETASTEITLFLNALDRRNRPEKH